MPASVSPAASVAKAPSSTAGPLLKKPLFGYEINEIGWPVKLWPP